MNEYFSEIDKLSPPSLLTGFTKGKFATWIVAAALIHVVVIGGMSIGYIRDTWIDPEGAAQRKAAAEVRVKAAAEKAAPPAKLPATPPAPVTNSEATLLQERKNTPVIKAITETVATNDIPKQPDDIDLSIKDTQIR